MWLYSHGLLLVVCWLASTVIAVLGLHLLAATHFAVSGPYGEPFAARLSRWARGMAAIATAGTAAAGLYFAFTPFTFGGYHPLWALACLGCASLAALVALAPLPRRVPAAPLTTEVWPY